MYQKLLILALVAVPSWALAETYRYVDEDGVVHYSDRPVEGAELVNIRGAQTFSNSNRQISARPAPSDPDPSEGFKYQSLQVVQPPDDGTVWNTGGQLRVVYRVSPSLRRGDRIQFYYDGQPVGEPGRSLAIELDQVYRGEHQLQAIVEDPDGNVVGQSETTAFHYRQTSIRN